MVKSSELIVVGCDINLGNILDDIEFDAEYATALMRGRGMTEAAIAETIFNFNYGGPQGDDKIVTLGMHDEQAGTITSFIATSHACIAEGVDIDLSEQVKRYAKKRRQDPRAVLTPRLITILDEMKTRRVEERLNRLANETLFHEIDHRIEAVTTDEEARIKRKVAYIERRDFSRQLKISAITMAATVAIGAPFVEVHYYASQSLIEKTFIAGMIAAGVLSIAGNIYTSKKPYGSLSHKEYLQSPWEIEARRFAAEAMQTGDATAIYPRPLTLRLKPIQFQYL